MIEDTTNLSKSLVVTAYQAYDPTGTLPRTQTFPGKVSSFVNALMQKIRTREIAVNDAYREARWFGEQEYLKLYADELTSL